MDQKEATMYQVTKMFNWTEAETKERLFDGDELKDDYADIILEADKARVEKFKNDRTQSYDKGVRETEKKLKTFAESEFKRLTGYDGTEDNFESMFKTWHEKEKAKLVKNVEVSEDAIKKHPAYISLEADRIPKTEYETLKSEYEQFKQNQERSKVMGVVTANAWDVVAKANPILSENATVAENRKRDFLAKFSGYNYDLQGSTILVLDKDGKRIENEHGNPIPFDTWVMDMASQNFDFRAQDDKGNAGNKDKGGQGVIVITDKPTTAAEYNQAIAKWNGSGEDHAKMRIAIAKYYKEHKKD